MESILRDQKQLVEELDRLIRNYNKDGQARKNKEYLTERLEECREIFSKISRNNDRLEPMATKASRIGETKYSRKRMQRTKKCKKTSIVAWLS